MRDGHARPCRLYAHTPQVTSAPVTRKRARMYVPYPKRARTCHAQLAAAQRSGPNDASLAEVLT